MVHRRWAGPRGFVGAKAVRALPIVIARLFTLGPPAVRVLPVPLCTERIDWVGADERTGRRGAARPVDPRQHLARDPEAVGAAAERLSGGSGRTLGGVECAQPRPVRGGCRVCGAPRSRHRSDLEKRSGKAARGPADLAGLRSDGSSWLGACRLREDVRRGRDRERMAARRPHGSGGTVARWRPMGDGLQDLRTYHFTRYSYGFAAFLAY